MPILTADAPALLVRGMADAPFWLVWLAMTLGSLWMLRTGVRAFWRLRTVADTPTARVRSAAQGYVELAGIARAHHREIEARLSCTPCLWCRFRVEERRRAGRNSRWVTLETGETDRPLRLDDGSGVCLIDPRGARVETRRRQVWLGPRRDPADPRPAALRLGPWFTLTAGRSNRYRFTEERIAAGDPLYVLGHLETPRLGPEEETRLERSLLRVWKRDPVRMAALDTDGDGEISVAEWEQARGLASRLARESARSPARAGLSRVRATGDSDRPFVIATYTEPELLSALRWKTLGYTAGFLVLSTAWGFALVARLAGAP
jgi:hypothetical protein